MSVPENTTTPNQKANEESTSREEYVRRLLDATTTISQDGYAPNIERFIRFRGTEDNESVEVQTLEARGLNENYPPNMAAHINSELALAVFFKQADETQLPMGTFYVMNEVHSLVQLRAPVNQWNRQGKGRGTTDADIVSRRDFFLDFDPVRPVKGISASASESKLATDAAVACYAQLAIDLGSDEFLGYGFSGNGAQAHVALDSLPNTAETTATVRGLLVAGKYIFAADGVELDTTVSDAKRLCPAWGTVKRKGSDDPERPHRRTWFWCHATVRRLTLVQLEALLALWMSRLTPEQRVEVDNAMGKKPIATPSKSQTTVTEQVKVSSQPSTPSSPTPGAAKPGPFGEANAVPVKEVAAWLGLLENDCPICPGCKTTGNSSVAFVGNGLKCLHNRCAQKGKAGYRTVVDLVVEAKGVTPVQAVRLVAAQFNLPDTLGGSANIANTATSSAAWSAPVPFDGATELPPFPTFAFPGWMRAWVEAEATATQTPTDLAAMTALGVLSAAEAKKYSVQVRDGWVEPVNLYIVTALGSANRKSAVQRDAEKPLRDYELELITQEAGKVEKAKAQHAVLEARLKKAIADAAKDPSNDAEVQRLSEEFQKSKVPHLPRLLVNDVTTEKLAVVMSEQGGRIALFSTEGGIFETMAGRYTEAANIDLPLQAHAGDDVRVDRIGRSSIHLRAPALTMCLTVQPDVVQGLAAKPGFRGRGLLARLLFSMPVSLVGHRLVSPPPVPKGVSDAYVKGVEGLLRETGANTTEVGGEVAATMLTLSPEAHRHLTNLLGDLEPRMGPGGDLAHLADWVGKLAGTVARIAALLHLAEHPARVPISARTMWSAKAIGFYLLLHAKVAFEHMHADRAVGDAKYVLDALRRDRRVIISRRDLFERTKGRLGRVEELEKVLTLLVERGYIRKVEQAPQGPGRPSIHYEVNPLGSSQNSQNSQKAPAPPPVDGSTPNSGDVAAVTASAPSLTVAAPPSTPTAASPGTSSAASPATTAAASPATTAAASTPTLTPVPHKAPISPSVRAEREKERAIQRRFEKDEDLLLEARLAELAAEEAEARTAHAGGGQEQSVKDKKNQNDGRP